MQKNSKKNINWNKKQEDRNDKSSHQETFQPKQTWIQKRAVNTVPNSGKVNTENLTAVSSTVSQSKTTSALSQSNTSNCTEVETQTNVLMHQRQLTSSSSTPKQHNSHSDAQLFYSNTISDNESNNFNLTFGYIADYTQNLILGQFRDDCRKNKVTSVNILHRQKSLPTDTGVSQDLPQDLVSVLRSADYNSYIRERKEPLQTQDEFGLNFRQVPKLAASNISQ